MKKTLWILSMVGLVWTRSCQPAYAWTVNMALTNYDGTLATNNFRIYKAQDEPLVDGTYLVMGSPVRVYTTNGLATKNLLGGNYELRIEGYTLPRPIYFAVPTGEGTNDLVDLRITGVNFFKYGLGLKTLTVSGGLQMTNDGKGNFYLANTNTASGGGVTNLVGATGVATVTTNGNNFTVNVPTNAVRSAVDGAAIDIAGNAATADVATRVVVPEPFSGSTYMLGTDDDGDGTLRRGPLWNGSSSTLTANITGSAASANALSAGAAIAATSGANLTNLPPASLTTPGVLASNEFVSVLASAYQAPPLMTPLIGWNTWSSYGTSVNESNVMWNVMHLKTNGAYEAGLRLITVDDGWLKARDANGWPVCETNKFTDGQMARLADFIHTNGFLFGLYTETGPRTNTSSSYGPTSWGYEDIDAQAFARWKVDYVKLDGGIFYPENFSSTNWHRESTERFLVALAKNNHSPVINASGGGFQNWMAGKINSIRYTGWTNTEFTSPGDVVNYTDVRRWMEGIHSQRGFFGGPNFFPDIDPISFSSSAAAARTQMAGAAMLNSFLSLYITSSSWQMTILTNRDFLALHQDPMGYVAERTAKNNSSSVWRKRLTGTPALAVMLMNSGSVATNITCYFTNLGLGGGVATIYDVWNNSIVGYATNSYTATVASEDVALLRITPGVVFPYPTGQFDLVNYGFLGTSSNSPTYNNYPVAWYSRNRTADFTPITIRGTEYKGFAMNSAGSAAALSYWLGGGVSSVSALLATDDATTNQTAGLITVRVYVDGVIKSSNAFGPKSNAVPIKVETLGATNITFAVSNYNAAFYLDIVNLRAVVEGIDDTSWRRGLLQGNYEKIKPADWTTATANSGTVTVRKRMVLLNPSSTTSSSAAVRYGTDTDDRPGLVGDNQIADYFNWSKPASLSVAFTTYDVYPMTNQFFQASWGKVYNATTGDLDQKGIGFKVIGNGYATNYAVQVLTHDGTTLTTTTVTTIPRAGGYLKNTMTLMSDGFGNVTPIFNGVTLPVCTGGPTGTSQNRQQVILECNSGSGTTAQALTSVTHAAIMWGD